MKKQEYDTIDFLKFIAAIMIFVMHCNAFGDNERIKLVWECCSRWAVPFFFIVSSFFLCGKIDVALTDDERKIVLKTYVKRILSLYGLWALFNIPSIIAFRIYVPGVLKVKTYMDFFKNAVISSTFTGSWYLISCVFSACLCYGILYSWTVKKKLMFMSVVQAACILCSVYQGLLPKWMRIVFIDGLCFPLNLFGGFLYFGLGEAIYRSLIWLNDVQSWKFIIIAIASYTLFFVEIIMARKLKLIGTSDCGLFIIPVSICIVILAFRSSLKIKKHKLYRNLSTIIYCSQGNVLLVSSLLEKLGLKICFIRFSVCAICSIVICCFILKFQKNENYNWMKRLA